jgi:hypothetical protein
MMLVTSWISAAVFWYFAKAAISAIRLARPNGQVFLDGRQRSLRSDSIGDQFLGLLELKLASLDATLGRGHHLVRKLIVDLVDRQVAVESAIQDRIILCIFHILLSFFETDARESAGLNQLLDPAEFLFGEVNSFVCSGFGGGGRSLAEDCQCAN